MVRSPRANYLREHYSHHRTQRYLSCSHTHSLTRTHASYCLSASCTPLHFSIHFNWTPNESYFSNIMICTLKKWLKQKKRNSFFFARCKRELYAIDVDLLNVQKLIRLMRKTYLEMHDTHSPWIKRNATTTRWKIWFALWIFIATTRFLNLNPNGSIKMISIHINLFGEEKI